MIIPLSHENLRGRRWPWITIAIIAVNFVVFLFTIGPMDRQIARTGQLTEHILELNSIYPNAPITPEANELVESFKIDHPDIYKLLGDPARKRYFDPFDEHIHASDYTLEDAKTEMPDLCIQLIEAQSTSIAWNYAYHSVHTFAQSYVTATFLHGGWEHILFNMWFFWLVGTILEDLWGRVVYPVFYLVAGVFAWAVQGAMFPHSLLPALGASGAIAGLMGAFLYRFPTTKIRLGWLLWIRLIKFSVPAYIVLPLWLILQILSGLFARALGIEAGVAYWAHIGGFAFGAAAAWLLRASGIEQIADQAVEAKVSWTADPLIVRAGESLAENNPALAIENLNQLLARNPDSIDGWDLLLKAQTRAQDIAAQRQTLATLCRLHVVAGEMEQACRDYEFYKNMGGTGLQRATWLELCRYLETEQRWQSAAEEYEKLAAANPAHRSSISAAISAAQIYLTRLDRKDRAERLLKSADKSPVPHQEFQQQIDAGLAACARNEPQAATPSSYGR